MSNLMLWALRFTSLAFGCDCKSVLQILPEWRAVQGSLTSNQNGTGLESYCS